jgi:hypothetical protein
MVIVKVGQRIDSIQKSNMDIVKVRQRPHSIRKSNMDIVSDESIAKLENDLPNFEQTLQVHLYQHFLQ